jgi:hypothetical protein
MVLQARLADDEKGRSLMTCLSGIFGTRFGDFIKKKNPASVPAGGFSRMEEALTRSPLFNIKHKRTRSISTKEAE